ncbi:hypothetical protein T10_1048 [Trichinella papuae]|uniref:Uncharacterized protein n=1 Tax=Trichinella papuae TaxID=268474 RepID=A0A0V1LZ10_9BILA|nr:hypothetical protein T10_1048 [Trichinella papuae]
MSEMFHEQKLAFSGEVKRELAIRNWLKWVLIDSEQSDKYNERNRTAPSCVFLEIF